MVCFWEYIMPKATTQNQWGWSFFIPLQNENLICLHVWFNWGLLRGCCALSYWWGNSGTWGYIMQGGNDGCTYVHLPVVATTITIIDNVISYCVFTLCRMGAWRYCMLSRSLLYDYPATSQWLCIGRCSYSTVFTREVWWIADHDSQCMWVYMVFVFR